MRWIWSWATREEDAVDDEAELLVREAVRRGVIIPVAEGWWRPCDPADLPDDLPDGLAKLWIRARRAIARLDQEGTPR